MGKKASILQNIGSTYGRRTVLSYYEGKNNHYLCRCICGVERIVNMQHIKSGLSKSCGCLRREFMRDSVISGRIKPVVPTIKHGLRGHPIYPFYIGAKKRGRKGEFIDFYNNFLGKFIEAKKNLGPQITLYNINGDWTFINKSYIRQLKTGYSIDGKASNIGSIKKDFGVSYTVAKRIMLLGIHDSESIRIYIQKHNINNRGMTEYNGNLYSGMDLSKIHYNLTGEQLSPHTLKDRFRKSGYDKNETIEGTIDMSKSGGENNILKYIKSIYSGPVLSGYKVNHKGFRYEIDIYLPEFKIGFEYNGNYYHSYDKVGSSLHYKKKIASKERGIDLYFIWEDWFQSKRDIVHNFIGNKLGLSKDKLYARKCVIKDITKDSYINFCESNHIQGAGGYVQIMLGIFYNNILVGVGGFSNNELKRFCTKLDTNIVGGFSKMIKYYLTANNKHYLKTFADLDTVSLDNNVYKNNGFVAYRQYSHVYFYVTTSCGVYSRYHKSAFRKDRIVKKFNYIFRDNETEYEAMNKLGYFRCFSSGMVGYELRV